ncbi:thermonuclease family protein [Agrobacterium vitis]|uniref:thermonuclease family protein n=1 Tax=Agrobacterium vitis TaxID=373 RepID=UPI0015747835|nr:thermonuclease family protein [Agrobacterium vitis]NSZ53454.1 thermonuclease family protein [Agrobacterium vitis]NTA32213.1 thermonuclease family protein [Agrobacterium vitis]
MAARKAAGGARRGRANKRRSSGGTRAKRTGSDGSLWPWFGALVVVVAGVSAYDHRKELPGLIDKTFGTGGKYIAQLQGHAPRETSSRSETGPVPPASVPTPMARRLDPTPLPPATTMIPTASMMPRSRDDSPLPPATTLVPGQVVASLQPRGVDKQRVSGKFYYCGTSGLDNCVVDGDTFWVNKTKIRVADIDAPETEQAKCKSERDRGFAAKVRLRDLLSAGSFDLSPFGMRDEDQYGRKLRVVSRNGRSLGAMMVDEGLVRPWTGHRQPWC